MWNNSSTATSGTDFECNDIVAAAILSISCGIVRTFLILPMCAFVLLTSFRRWKPHRSFKTTSHSDFFTCHLAVMQLLAASGFIAYLGGAYTSETEVVRGGLSVYAVSLPAEVLVHSLTCVDRYLAVVHPITYLRLKQSIGIKIRNVSIGLVWIFSLVNVGILHHFYPKYTNELFIGLLVAASAVVSFCSISVLCVLVQPGPGDVEKVDKSKRKAFHTIIALLVVILIWFVGILLCLSVNTNVSLGPRRTCILFESMLWFNIPCSTVLLGLYIQRTRKFKSQK